MTAEPRGLDYAEVSADGVPAMWLVPHGADLDRAIVALHGGGFVGGPVCRASWWASSGEREK